jgi:hypothetical protein
MLTGLFTDLPTTTMWPFRRKPLDPHDFERRLLALELRQTDLELKHMSLRGRVYNAGIHKKPLPDSEEARADTIPTSKDELRRLAGIKAGRPYPHDS